MRMSPHICKLKGISLISTLLSLGWMLYEVVKLDIRDSSTQEKIVGIFMLIGFLVCALPYYTARQLRHIRQLDLGVVPSEHVSATLLCNISTSMVLLAVHAYFFYLHATTRPYNNRQFQIPVLSLFSLSASIELITSHLELQANQLWLNPPPPPPPQELDLEVVVPRMNRRPRLSADMSALPESFIPPILEDHIPDDFICPITQTIMRQPFATCLGHSYERSAIEHWLQTHGTSPKTGTVLQNKLLTPNYNLRNAIEKWLQDHQHLQTVIPPTARARP